MHELAGGGGRVIRDHMKREAAVPEVTRPAVMERSIQLLLPATQAGLPHVK